MRAKWGICAGVAIMVCGGALLYSGLMHCADSRLPVEGAQLITIAPGSSGKRVLQLLENQQLVQRPGPLWWLWRLYLRKAQFKAGTYRIEPGTTLRALLHQIEQGEEAQFALRFVEGSQYQQWLSNLKAAPHIRHTITAQSAAEVAQAVGIPNGQMEGWLFPDTYHYTAGTTDIELLRRAHQRMQQQLLAAWDGRRPQLPLNSPYELLILASLIEKETAVHEERLLVASVFINRLQRGMRLQSCSTVIYDREQPHKGVVSYPMLRQVTPHNTYQINGLPPTPIAMPGRAALQAAAQPAQSQYLYFVVKPEGGHIFSQDFFAHRQAAQAYRNSREARKAVLP